MLMDNNMMLTEKIYLKEKYMNIFKLKNNDFFGLLNMDFYLKEFIFFPRLMSLLADRNNLDDSKAQNLGIVSTLVYLSAKIHYSVSEDNNDQFASSTQFPILLGDLLYGKVIEVLMSSSCSSFLQDYLRYLQKLNATVVDHLNGDVSEEILNDLRFNELARLSAELLGIREEQELDLVKNLANAFSSSLKNESISFSIEQVEIANVFNFLTSNLKITSLDELCQNI